jgi:GR25 family glycosyltransferase involved in LPS biosynthesis
MIISENKIINSITGTGTNILSNDKISSKDIPIFIINLDKDTQRWDFIKYQLDFLNCKNYERISAVDMRKPNMLEFYKDERISLYTRFTIQKKYRCDHKQIDRTGAIGSTLSHYKIWQKIIDNNIDIAIILEDDMHMMSNFYDIIQNELNKYNNEFDILNFGYLKEYFSDVDNSKFHFGAGCYIVTKEACQILSKYVFPIDTHVDAYFFLLNHFGYLKMIMSDKNAVFNGGEFNSNIIHGNLKCMNNEIKCPNLKIEVNNKNENSHFNNILICLLLLIVTIITIKLYFIYKLKNL